MICRYI